MTTDNGARALRLPIADAIRDTYYGRVSAGESLVMADRVLDAILANGAAFLPADELGETELDRCARRLGIEVLARRKDAAELDRLRRIESAARDVVRPAKGIGREARAAVFNERLAALRVALDLSKLDYPKHYDHRRGCSRTHPATFPCDTGTPTAATIAFRAALAPEGSARDGG